MILTPRAQLSSTKAKDLLRYIMEFLKDKSAIVTIFESKKLIASFNSRELDLIDFKSGSSGKREEEEEEDSEEVGS